MADQVSIHVFGDDLFRRRIRAMRFRARNMSPVLEEIADEWLDIVEEQFDTEGARTGKKWQKLSIETMLQRGSSHPILIDSGDMFQHLITRDNIDVSDDSVSYSFGSDPEVARRAEAHQYGYINNLTHHPVPARPIFDFTDLDEQHWRDKIQKFLVTGDQR